MIRESQQTVADRRMYTYDKKRESLRKRMRQSKNQMDRNVFIHARRDAKYTLRQTKRKGWQTFCSGINDKTNLRDLWNFIRKIKGIPIATNHPFKINGAIITNPKEKASLLVKHYEFSRGDDYSHSFNEQKSLANEILKHHNSRQEAEDGIDLPFNADFSMFELNQALNNCKNGAPGHDDIYYSVLRNLSNNAKIQLLRLFSDSWKTGKPPDSWHEATIIRLLKPNKPKNDPASYRPISFTKLMQEMIKPRLCNYLEKNNLLSKYQSGC